MANRYGCHNYAPSLDEGYKFKGRSSSVFIGLPHRLEASPLPKALCMSGGGPQSVSLFGRTARTREVRGTHLGAHGKHRLEKGVGSS